MSRIKNAMDGSFTVSFDLDHCGQDFGGGVNYFQLALSDMTLVLAE
jgi:hypothetical protein